MIVGSWEILVDYGNLLLYLEILAACWFLGDIRLLVSGRCWLVVGYWEILVDCWFWEILVTEGLSANSPRSNQPSLPFQLSDPISSTANIALGLTISKRIIRKTFATIMVT